MLFVALLAVVPCLFIAGLVDDIMFRRADNRHADRRAFQKRLNRVLKGAR